MAVDPNVSLESVLGTLTGRTNVTVVTKGGTSVTGTLSVVGVDVVIYSPAAFTTTSIVIPFNAIDHVIVPS